MSMMLAKMKVVSVERDGDTEMVSFSAVCKNQYDEEGLDENNTFAKFTPAAELGMMINNPALVGKMMEGEEYYIDFSKAG